MLNEVSNNMIENSGNIKSIDPFRGNVKERGKNPCKLLLPCIVVLLKIINSFFFPTIQ